MRLVDTHCHLGMYVDVAEVEKRAGEADVDIVVATTRASEYREISRLNGKGVQVGLGLHPELAGSVHAPYERAIFSNRVHEATWINEVGLDAVIADSVSSNFGATPTMAAQQELFDWVLNEAGPGRVYSVHSRGAEAETLKMLVGHGCRAVVLHNFLGTPQQVRTAVEEGYYFSIHPASLDDTVGRDVLVAVPPERLLVETDGPYFSWRTDSIEPAHCPQIVERIADIVTGHTPAQLRETLTDNFQALLNAAEQRRS